LGVPKSPYIQYLARNGRWEQVPLDSKLQGRPANLLTGPSARGEPKLVSVEVKERRNSNAADRYRRILDVWSTNC
jgi:hypothetical protein